MFWFEFAIDVCFLCDIALNFMTAFVHINDKVISAPNLSPKPVGLISTVHMCCPGPNP